MAPPRRSLSVQRTRWDVIKGRDIHGSDAANLVLSSRCQASIPIGASFGNRDRSFAQLGAVAATHSMPTHRCPPASSPIQTAPGHLSSTRSRGVLDTAPSFRACQDTRAACHTQGVPQSLATDAGVPKRKASAPAARSQVQLPAPVAGCDRGSPRQTCRDHGGS